MHVAIFRRSLPSQFQEVIHNLKAVMLFSNCCAAALGELLRECREAKEDGAREDRSVDLDVLFDLSALGQMISLLCAALLPLTSRLDVGGLTQTKRQGSYGTHRRLVVGGISEGIFSKSLSITIHVVHLAAASMSTSCLQGRGAWIRGLASVRVS